MMFFTSLPFLWPHAPRICRGARRSRAGRFPRRPASKAVRGARPPRSDRHRPGFLNPRIHTRPHRPPDPPAGREPRDASGFRRRDVPRPHHAPRQMLRLCGHKSTEAVFVNFCWTASLYVIDPRFMPAAARKSAHISGLQSTQARERARRGSVASARAFAGRTVSDSQRGGEIARVLGSPARETHSRGPLSPPCRTPAAKTRFNRRFLV